MREPDPGPLDRGLARERTELAWNRSGLAAVVCIAVLLRHIWPLQGTGQVVALASVSAGAAVWALALTVGSRASSASTGGTRGRLSPGRARAITAGTLALALAGLGLAFFPPS